MKCALHPDVETNLRCGKCDQPICPRCLVQTPVGARCPKCANVRKLPVFEVPATYYLRAAGAGFGTAGVLGAIWPFLPFGGFFSLLIGAGIGYAIGEAMSLSVNRKRGRWLQVIAGISMVVSYGVMRVIDAPHASLIDMFLNPYGLIACAIGIIVSVSRLR